jgi:hypothetical protein
MEYSCFENTIQDLNDNLFQNKKIEMAKKGNRIK